MRKTPARYQYIVNFDCTNQGKWIIRPYGWERYQWTKAHLISPGFFTSWQSISGYCNWKAGWRCKND